MVDKLLVYGHSGCPMVGAVRSWLERAAVPYDYVDIRQDPAAAIQVRALNRGYESVPTLVFPDGTVLTEPSARELLTHLQTSGD